MKSIVQRIGRIIERKGLTVSAFEKSVGMSNGSFASQLKNNKTIGSDKLENIVNTYSDISYEWLLTGKGEMFKSESKSKALPNDEVSLNIFNKNIEPVSFTPIPLLSLSAKAGEVIESFRGNEIRGTIQIPEQIARAGAIAIPVEGDSMFPTVHNGDIAVCTRIMNASDLIPNNVYVIFTNDGESAVIKRYSHEDEENIHLNSDNAHYQTIRIPKEDVGAILQLRGTFSTNFPMPIHDRLRKREVKIEALEENLEKLRFQLQESQKETQLAQKENISLLKKLTKMD